MWKYKLRTRPKNEVTPQLRDISLLSDEAGVLNRTTLEILLTDPPPPSSDDERTQMLMRVLVNLPMVR